MLWGLTHWCQCTCKLRFKQNVTHRSSAILIKCKYPYYQSTYPKPKARVTWSTHNFDKKLADSMHYVTLQSCLFYNHTCIFLDSVNLIKWQIPIPLWPAFVLYALQIYHAHFGMLFLSFTKLYFIRIKKNILVSCKQSAICLLMYLKQINRIKYRPYNYSIRHLSFRDERNPVNV